MSLFQLAKITLLSLALAATSAALHAQPSCAQMPCIRSECVLGMPMCGNGCYCAATGPGGTGICVNR